MQELYDQALRCYQQNDYEGALQLLRQCEMSTQVKALQDECKRVLIVQYQYIIQDAANFGDKSMYDDYSQRYKQLMGDDDFLDGVTVTEPKRKEEIESEVQEQSGFDGFLARIDQKLFPKTNVVVGAFLVVNVMFVLMFFFMEENYEHFYMPALLTGSILACVCQYLIIRNNGFDAIKQKICCVCIGALIIATVFYCYYTCFYEQMYYEESYALELEAAIYVIYIIPFVISVAYGNNEAIMKTVVLLGLASGVLVLMYVLSFYMNMYGMNFGVYAHYGAILFAWVMAGVICFKSKDVIDNNLGNYIELDPQLPL